MTFGTVYALWLRDHVLHNCVAGEYRNLCSIYRVHLKEPLGEVKLTELKRSRLMALLRQKEAAQLSRQTVLHIRNAISRPIAWAITNLDLDLEHPFSTFYFRYKGQRQRSIRYLEKEVVQRFFRACEEQNSPYTTYYYILYYLGLRPSEGLGLQRKDIGPEFLQIRRAVTNDGPKQTKCATAIRDLPICAGLRKILDDYLATLPPGQEWLFAKSIDDVPKLTRVTNNFRRLKARTAIWDSKRRRRGEKRKCLKEAVEFKLYDFRHTFATNLVRKDVPIAKISQLMGHSDISVTMAYYVERLKEDLKELGDKLEPEQ